MAGAPFLPQWLAGTLCGTGWELRALTGRCPQTIPSIWHPCQLPRALPTTSSPGVHLQLGDSHAMGLHSQGSLTGTQRRTLARVRMERGLFCLLGPSVKT